MCKLIPANTNFDFETIAKLADVIWREHYIPIIGKSQVDYMLKKFQSVDSIFKQVKNGFEYFMIHFENSPVGYISLKRENDTLFLSKFYILSTYRGKNIGKKTMQFIEEKAKKKNCKSIKLTVNKNNANSIKVYKKLGFVNTGAIVIDIGSGFIMDDYEMVKTL